MAITQGFAQAGAWNRKQLNDKAQGNLERCKTSSQAVIKSSTKVHESYEQLKAAEKVAKTRHQMILLSTIQEHRHGHSKDSGTAVAEQVKNKRRSRACS